MNGYLSREREKAKDFGGREKSKSLSQDGYLGIQDTWDAGPYWNLGYFLSCLASISIRISQWNPDWMNVNGHPVPGWPWRMGPSLKPKLKSKLRWTETWSWYLKYLLEPELGWIDTRNRYVKWMLWTWSFLSKSWWVQLLKKLVVPTFGKSCHWEPSSWY